MPKSKLPGWLRLLRFYFKCLWYYVIFPVGVEENEFSKQWKNDK